MKLEIGNFYDKKRRSQGDVFIRAVHQRNYGG